MFRIYQENQVFFLFPGVHSNMVISHTIHKQLVSIDTLHNAYFINDQIINLYAFRS